MENSSSFLYYWHTIMSIGAVVMLALGILIYLLHKIKVSGIKEFKGKYDYLNAKEISNYKKVILCIALAAGMLINLYGKGNLTDMGLWFYVRLFISVSGGTLVGYVSILILENYYPTILNKKLRKWRYMPRINPKTGSQMRLLSEEEEDVHLEEGMQAEENVFSIDYDVWVDDASGDIKVEKYIGHLSATKCNSCGFYTMRVVREEITQQPTEFKAGELVKHYQCSYCKSIRATAFKISTRVDEDYKALAMKPNVASDVDLIRIEIHYADANKKFFEFQTYEQAKKFLEEVD